MKSLNNNIGSWFVTKLQKLEYTVHVLSIEILFFRLF